MPITKYGSEGLEQTRSDMRSIEVAVREMGQGFREMGDYLKTSNLNLLEQRTVIWAMRRTYMALRTEIRMLHATGLELMRAFRHIGRIGRQLMGMWQAYIIAQIRVERLTRDVADAEEEVAKWTDITAKYLRDFGANSSYYLDAAENLEEATDDLDESQRRLNQAQQENIAGWISMGLQIFDLIATLYLLHIRFHILARMIQTGGPLATALGGLAGLFTTKLLVALAAVGSYIALTLIVNWEELVAYWHDTVDPAIDDLEIAWGELQTAFGVADEDLQTLAESFTWLGKTVIIELIDSLVDLIDFMTDVTTWLKDMKIATDAFFRGDYSTTFKIMWDMPTIDVLQGLVDIMKVLNPPFAVLLENMLKAFRASLPEEQIGGIIPFTGPYMLHAGERVISEQVRTSGGANIRSVHIENYIQGMGEESGRRAGEASYRAFMQLLERMA